jgi:hypothetical protein
VSRVPQPQEPGLCRHDMVPGTCGECRTLAEAVDPYGDVLIERFTIAAYDTACVLVSKHRCISGTTIGLAISEEDGKPYGWCCALCVEVIAGGHGAV